MVLMLWFMWELISANGAEEIPNQPTTEQKATAAVGVSLIFWTEWVEPSKSEFDDEVQPLLPGECDVKAAYINIYRTSEMNLLYNNV